MGTTLGWATAVTGTPLEELLMAMKLFSSGLVTPVTGMP